jgi:RNase P subunit RPR2
MLDIRNLGLKRKYCPKCGSLLIPSVEECEMEPKNARSIELLERYGLFFPHIVIAYTCEKDGHRKRELRFQCENYILLMEEE